LSTGKTGNEPRKATFGIAGEGATLHDHEKTLFFATETEKNVGSYKPQESQPENFKPQD